MEKEDMHTKQQSEDSVCKSVPHQPKSKTRKVATTKKRACKGNSSIDIISIMLIILNIIFEDALSSANFKFREKYKEDYKIAARYVWETLYASVGLDTFTEAEIDKVIRVYRNMLESKEFDEYKENINLITSALELIKADSSFIDSEIVEMMANNN